MAEQKTLAQKFFKFSLNHALFIGAFAMLWPTGFAWSHEAVVGLADAARDLGAGAVAKAGAAIKTAAMGGATMIPSSPALAIG